MADKVLENRIRRMAERRRMVLTKIRRIDPKAFDYGKFRLKTSDGEDVHFSGEPFGSLDEIEAFLGDQDNATAPTTLKGMLTEWFVEKPDRMKGLGLADPRLPEEAADAILSGDPLGIAVPAQKLLESVKPVVESDPSEVGQAIVSLLQTVADRN